MKDAIYKIAERKIQEAIENGELDHLPGRGKPLKLDADEHVPEEMRAVYKIMKNAGVLPEEIDLQKTITMLQEQLAKAASVEEKRSLKGKLAEKQLYYDILIEKRRRR